MYCMNCGVRLGEGESRCPLCGLRAYHPELPKQSGDSLYPKQWVAPEPERTSMRFLLTVIGLVAGVVCLLVDLGLWGRVTWSGYVLGGLAVAYALLALPLWFRRPNPVLLLPVDFVAVGLYLLYINLKNGGGWFLSFAFPVTGIACVLTTAVVALTHYLPSAGLFLYFWRGQHCGGLLCHVGRAVPVHYLWRTDVPLELVPGGCAVCLGPVLDSGRHHPALGGRHSQTSIYLNNLTLIILKNPGFALELWYNGARGDVLWMSTFEF